MVRFTSAGIRFENRWAKRTSAHCRRDQDPHDETAVTGVQIANTSMLPGASGAPVYNLDAGEVETLGDYTNSCVYFYNEPNGLFLLQQNCPGNYSAVNGPVTVISTLPGFHDADLIFRNAFEQ